jgi:hypothetical protein
VKNTTDETAFPLQPGQVVLDHQGMSLRDWFAGQACTGLSVKENLGSNNSYRYIAETAFCIADAMIEARNRAPHERTA